jgi:2'-5' RNA ligase
MTFTYGGNASVTFNGVDLTPYVAVTAPVQAKALTGPPDSDARDGVMIALYPDAGTAAKLAMDGGTTPDELHITVAYAGKADQVDADALAKAARGVATRGPVTGTLSGHARFTGGKHGDVLVALFDSADLEQLRGALLTALTALGIDIPRDHGFTAHMTLGYLDPADELPLRRIDPLPLTFTDLAVVHGPNRTDVPFQSQETTDMSAEQTEETKGNPFGKGSIGGGKGEDAGPRMSTGAFVTLGNRKGRIDLIVTSGTVPGATSPTGEPVEGSKGSPAARVVEYEPAGDGTFKATGKKFASTVAKLKRSAPLRTRSTKSLEEALAWAQVGHGDPDHDGPDHDGPAPSADALRTVYERGVKSWPGQDVTALDAHQWGLGRVDGFVALLTGFRPDGYTGDDDLLPDDAT